MSIFVTTAEHDRCGYRIGQRVRLNGFIWVIVEIRCNATGSWLECEGE